MNGDSGPAFARTIADYFNALVGQGLERKEALELTHGYQESLLDGQRGEVEDESS